MSATTPRAEFLRDIAITAVEGGIGYWSSCTKYRWSKDGTLAGILPFPVIRIVAAEDPDDFVGALVEGTQHTPTEEDGPEVTITADTIRKGIAAIVANPDLINSTDRKSVILADTDNDACFIDADSADCIVQIGLFGKLVFG
jgi:hypothetical protein